MKILLLLASAIAVFTADFPDNPDGGDAFPDDGLRSAHQDQLSRDGPTDNTDAGESQTFHKESDVYSFAEVVQNFPGGPVLRNSEFEDGRFEDEVEFVTEETQAQVPGSSEVDHQAIKERKIQNERRLRGSQCSANAICGIVDGSCIDNNTVCSGWLVSGGCKGSCKCCIPRSQEMQMKIFTLELQWLKEDLVNSSLQLKTDLLSMIENVNTNNAGLKNQLSKEIYAIKDEVLNQGCPGGLFWFGPSNQCLKFLNTTYDWETANKKCSELGLVLAKPYDPVSLRHYLIAKYGTTTGSWVGAQGAVTSTKWTRDGQAIATNSILWYSGHNGIKPSSYCLVLATHPNHQKSYPNAPYYTDVCSNKFLGLCEFVRELATVQVP